MLKEGKFKLSMTGQMDVSNTDKDLDHNSGQKIVLNSFYMNYDTNINTNRLFLRIICGQQRWLITRSQPPGRVIKQ